MKRCIFYHHCIISFQYLGLKTRSTSTKMKIIFIQTLRPQILSIDVAQQDIVDQNNILPELGSPIVIEFFDPNLIQQDFVNPNTDVLQDTVDSTIYDSTSILPDPPALISDDLELALLNIDNNELIQKDVESCLTDLIEKVETQAAKTKNKTRKRSIDKPTWVVNKRKIAAQSGKEHTNHKGKLIPAKK